MSPLQIAYILLTIACCTGFLAALFLYEKREHTSFAFVPGMLFLAIATNIARRALRVHLPDDLFAPRLLFFVWPLCCSLLLLLSFGNRKLAGVTCFVFSALYFALALVPGWFIGHITHVSQVISACIGLSAFALLVQSRKRRPFMITPPEVAGVFCGVAEGLTALINHLVPREWWPVVLVYSALYLALIFLHVAILWNARPTNAEPLNQA